MKSKFSYKLAQKAQEHLESGEQFLVGIRVNAHKSSSATGKGPVTNMILFGAFGTEILQRTSSKTQKASGLKTSMQMALGLTNKRILVFRRSIWTGGVKDFIGSIDRKDVSGASVEKQGFGYNIEITLRGDKKLEVQGVKIDDCEEFVSELNK